MTTSEILKAIRMEYPECLLADGFEDAIIGLVEGACRAPVVCYDYGECVKILMATSDMDEEMAEEYIDFNVTGAYLGDMTPLFLHRWR